MLSGRAISYFLFVDSLLAHLTFGLFKSVTLSFITLDSDFLLLFSHLVLLDLHLAHLVSHGLLSVCNKLRALCGTTKAHHAGLNLVKVILLRTENRAGACYANPSDERRGGETVVFHSVECDKRASATKTSFAMDGDSTALFFDFLHEALCNVIWRSRSINKLKIEMLQTLVDKLLTVISRFV